MADQVKVTEDEWDEKYHWLNDTATCTVNGKGTTATWTDQHELWPGTGEMHKIHRIDHVLREDDTRTFICAPDGIEVIEV